MPAYRSAIAVIFATAACGVAPKVSETIDAAPQMADVATNIELTSDEAGLSGWQVCASQDADWFGNRWWGEMQFCSGDLRIHLYAESVDLSGPVLNVYARTKMCFSGEGTLGTTEMVPETFFLSTDAEQLRQVRELIRLTVSPIGVECGGPFEASLPLPQNFEAQFDEFADRYWRYLDEGKLTAALARED